MAHNFAKIELKLDLKDTTIQTFKKIKKLLCKQLNLTEKQSLFGLFL